MATGYKLSFKKMSAYDAPMYRGNKPASYIIATPGTWANGWKFKWVRSNWPVQELVKNWLRNLTYRTRDSRNSYAAGWQVFSHYRLILHTGAIPISLPLSALVVKRWGGRIGQYILRFYYRYRARYYDHTERNRGKAHSPWYESLFDHMSLRAVLILSPFILLALVLLIRSLIKLPGRNGNFPLRGWYG